MYKIRPTLCQARFALFPFLAFLLLALVGIPIHALAAVETVASAETQTIDLSSHAGIRWEFRPEAGDWKPIMVPGGGWRTQGYTCDAGTYRTTIPIPASAAGKTVRIVFAAINFGADISAGPDADHLQKASAHVDGWVPVSADVTSVAVPGKPLVLQVEVKGRQKFRVNGKFTVPEGASWTPGIEEGILRGVTLEVLPRVHVEDAFVQTATEPTPTFGAKISLTNGGAQQATVSVEAELLPAYNGEARFRYPRLAPVSATIAAGKTQTIDLQKAAWTLGRTSYWWPNVPYRPGYRATEHVLEIRLRSGGKIVHVYRQRFGFRSFAAKGNHYYLNGVRCNLRGDNQQEADFGIDAYGTRPGFGPPSPGNGGWPEAVDNLLRLNFNVLRIHQIPATPYMLDVCDERGLMLVEESPLRGSEGGESYADGKDNMLNMDRELVRRDRDHPAVVLWSAANEWSDPIRDAMRVIREQDTTRPIIADGIGDIGPDVINMEHYVNGIDGMPIDGGHPRTDRPYGETESIWSHDNTLQGFAWMATSIRTRRLRGDADLRNYVLNNAWPNYVPGENPQNEILEKRVKHMDDQATILPSIADPWHNAHIVLMQRCYNPVAACDVEFDRVNARSNANGDWPTRKPRLPMGTPTSRSVAVFNDDFSDPNVTLRYAFHRGGNAQGALIMAGERKLTIPPGEFARVDLPFTVPDRAEDVTMTLVTLKGGVERFREDRMVFRVIAASDALAYPAGDYQLISHLSGLPAVIHRQADAAAPVVLGTRDEAVYWHLEYQGNPSDGNIRLTQETDKSVLTIQASPHAAGTDGTNAIALLAPTDDPAQYWHITEIDDDTITLTNRASGKLLDVYARATTPGSRIAQWSGNGGDNQVWELVPRKR